VGASAIESIVACRDAEGRYRSLADLCARVDLRLVNKRVLESLIKVGALNELGHPAQLLMALDDAMAFGQAQQRDRVSGQGSLFDMLGSEDSTLERPLPRATEAPARERLRWEKELLGLYLSDHPMGELAAEMGRYATAYSGDLGEELDQQRIVVGGVMTGLRRVVTKARATMAVATLEDLQGPLEVVVFPKVFEETGATWVDDAILVVAGRVDHKGEETVLLADSVWTWEQATAMGPDAFAAAVAASDRSRRGGQGGARRWGNGQGNGNGSYSNGANGANGHADRERPTSPGSGPGGGTRLPVAVPIDAKAGPPAAPRIAVPVTPSVPPVVRTIALVSPLRDGGVLGRLEVIVSGPGSSSSPRVFPIIRSGDPGSIEPGSIEPDSLQGLGPDDHEEPALPDEASAVVARMARQPTVPVEAAPGQTLHIRFRHAPGDDVVRGFGELRAVIQERPGETPVVLHIPSGPGREQQMQLRIGVAYDTDFVAEVQRRLGEGLVQLHLE